MDVSNVIQMVRAYVYYSNPLMFLVRQFIRLAAVDTATKPVPCELKCLDVGAGTVPYRRDIEKAFGVAHYIAADIAPTDQCNLVANGCHLPLADGTLDLVVAFEVIQHTPQPDLLLEEIARVLRPGGCFLVTFPFLYAECDLHDYHRWTIEGMAGDVKRAGFEIARTQRWGGGGFAAARFLHWAVQHAIPGKRHSWRAARTTGNMFLAGVSLLLTIPTTLLSWLALPIDAAISAKGCYVGGAVLARKLT